MKTRLVVERYGPVTLAICCGICWYVWKGVIPGVVAKELLASVLSAAAISAGFLTTALSMLMSLGNTQVGRRLRRRKRLPYLLQYLKSAIYGCLYLSASCLLGFFSYDEQAGIGTLPATVLVTAFAFAGSSLGRIGKILAEVLSQMSAPDDLEG